jgi:hypothetical protein
MTSEWFIDLQIDNVTVVQYQFFNGIGYSSPIYSVPTGTTYNDGLLIALESLKDYG